MKYQDRTSSSGSGFNVASGSGIEHVSTSPERSRLIVATVRSAISRVLHPTTVSPILHLERGDIEVVLDPDSQKTIVGPPRSFGIRKRVFVTGVWAIAQGVVNADSGFSPFTYTSKPRVIIMGMVSGSRYFRPFDDFEFIEREGMAAIGPTAELVSKPAERRVTFPDTPSLSLSRRISKTDKKPRNDVVQVNFRALIG